MLNFLKRELEAKERSISVGATFTNKRKQSFNNEIFSSSALLNQEEEHVSFVAYQITNLTNV